MNRSLWIVIAVLALVVLIFVLGGCGVGEETPVDNDPVPAPEPVGDAVLVSAGGLDSLIVPRVIVIQAGDWDAYMFVLVAGAAKTYELVVAQEDTTAAVLRSPEAIDYHLGSLVPADDWGRIVAASDLFVPITAQFDQPWRTQFAFPMEAKAPGRSLVHLLWQLETGERLGLAVTEVRVE